MVSTESGLKTTLPEEKTPFLPVSLPEMLISGWLRTTPISRKWCTELTEISRNQKKVLKHAYSGNIWSVVAQEAEGKGEHTRVGANVGLEAGCGGDG